MHHRNERNALIQHGTMTLVRRQSLESVGGWSEWCICEDTELGLRLIEKGYDTRYVDHVLGRGLTPSGFAAIKSQRFRWAFGAMQILKAHLPHMIGRSKLNLAQRYHFLTGWFAWLGDALQLVFAFGSLLWTLGILLFPKAFGLPVTALALPILGFMAFKAALGPILYRRTMDCPWKDILGASILSVGLAHAIARGVFAGLVKKKGVFVVTPKGWRGGGALAFFNPIREEIGLLVALLMGAATLVAQRGADNLETQLWVGILCLQCIPYVAAFADRVASKYLDHISTNANGGHEIPANVHDPMALDYVQEAMKAAGMTEAEVREFASRMARGGPSHTKARLDLDVLKEYTDADGKTFRLMDIMETDPIELLRGQARRVSGEVALTQHGVMGSAGLKLLRRAAEKAQKAGDAGHVKGMEAFDQVAAEMLGRPFGDEMPTWMEGALTANAASNLGFMGWMQMGELINTAAGLGVLDTMKMVSDFPRLMQEVKVLAKGGKVENGILGSLEVSGAEIGLAGYKMITQNDNPSSIHAAVGRQDSGTLIKSVRVMGHKLGTVSLHRIIQATQVRGVAEQITKKSLRYIREGKESKALADMGFTPDMVERIKAELPAIAKWDANGTLASLDMTKASDPALIGDFIATVNRGAGQLIQDTFIGEKGAWQHSNLGKVMTQFRSFPITAMEKQWGRLRGMHGAPAALGIIMAAAPLGFAMYAARTAVNAIGRPDSDEYIERQFQPLAVGRGLMNYIGALGLAPDMMDALTAVVVPDDLKKEWGLQTRVGSSPTLGGIVPVVGYADTWLRAANNLDNPHAIVRALPFSNAPWTVPLINLLRPE